MDILLYQIFVEGKVQGVWFRKYTHDKAKDIGVKGFVRNEINHTVYIEAEGNLEQLRQFTNWLYKGSPLSKVASVKFKTSELKYFDTFKILS